MGKYEEAYEGQAPRKPGRPPSENPMKKVFFYCDPKRWEMAEEYAKAENTNRSQLIRDLLDEAFGSD